MSYLNEKNAVLGVVTKYLDGAYEGNSELLRQAFHPNATMCGYLFDAKVISTPESYIDEVEKNPSPKSTGENMQSLISYVDLCGPVANVTLQISGYWGSDGTDYLQLIKEDTGWKIINKTFHIHKPV